MHDESQPTVTVSTPETYTSSTLGDKDERSEDLVVSVGKPTSTPMTSSPPAPGTSCYSILSHFPIAKPATEASERKSKFYPKLFRAIQIKPAFPKQGSGRWSDVASFRARVPDGPLVQVFYPCEQLSRHDRKRHAGIYMRSDAAAGLAAYVGMASVGLSPLINKKHHVLNEAPPHPQLVHRAAGMVPVIIFSHGLAGNSDMYSITCKDLASQGYVVWAIEHEDASASFARTASGELIVHDVTQWGDFRLANGEEFDLDNKDHYTEARGPQLAKRVSEVDAVVACIRDPSKYDLIRVVDTSLRCAPQLPNPQERFKAVLRLMDGTKLVMAGHSFGGATAALATKQHHGFLALIIYDIWSMPLEGSMLDEDLGLPTLSIVSDGFADNMFTNCTKRLLRGNSAPVDSFLLSGCPHQAFSDTPFFSPVWLAKKTKNVGTTPRTIVRSAIVDLSADFLKRHVRNPVDLLPVETPLDHQPNGHQSETRSHNLETVLQAPTKQASKSWAAVVSPFKYAL